LERQLFEIAEKMAEDKFCFRPTPNVRTFGEQFRHIAAVQWVVAAGILGEKPPVDVGDGDSGPILMTAKSEILKYARDSFAYMSRAIATINESNRLERIPHPFDAENTRVELLTLVAGYAGHGWNHYGQMVVYERMSNIVRLPGPAD
jgi:hypothetical protein